MLDNLDLRNRQADAEHIVSYLSTDALESPYNFALSSCNHMVHYNCFSRMMQREGATLHKNCSDFLCPVCRRLATCFFPILVTPQIIYFLVFFLLPAYYFFSSFSQVLIMDAIISGLSSAKERT